MNPINIFKVIFIITLIQIVRCVPVGDMSDLEYGPGYSTYGHQQMRVARLRGIRPVVDTISEKEKYGNDGGNIRYVSKTIIKVSEGASASISNALGTPNDNTYNVLKPFDSFFADLGSRLGGLA